LGGNEDGKYQGNADTDTTFKGSVGGDGDDQLKDTDQIDGGAGQGNNTLDLTLNDNWDGFTGDGKAENIQTVDLEAGADGENYTFSASGITPATDIKLTNKGNSAISVSDLPATAENVTISQLSTANDTTLTWAEDAKTANVTITDAAEDAGLLTVKAAGATEASVTAKGDVQLGGDSALDSAETVNLATTGGGINAAEVNLPKATAVTVSSDEGPVQLGSVGGENSEDITITAEGSGGVEIAELSTNGQAATVSAPDQDVSITTVAAPEGEAVTATVEGGKVEIGQIGAEDSGAVEATLAGSEVTVESVKTGDDNATVTAGTEAAPADSVSLGSVDTGAGNMDIVSTLSDTGTFEAESLTGNEVNVTVSGGASASANIDATGAVSYKSDAETEDTVTISGMEADGSTISTGAGADTVSLAAMTAAADKVSEVSVDLGADEAADTLELGAVDPAEAKVLLKVSNYREGDSTVLTGAANPAEIADAAAAQTLLETYGISADASEITINPAGFQYKDAAGAEAEAVSITYDGYEYVAFGNTLLQITSEGAAEEPGDVTVNGTYEAYVGGSDTPQLDADTTYVGTDAEDTLAVGMSENWDGFGEGSVSGVENIKLTADAAGAMSFSANGISDATSYEIVNGSKDNTVANGPISVSDLGEDAENVSIDQLSTTEATSLAWSGDPAKVTISATGTEGLGGSGGNKTDDMKNWGLLKVDSNATEAEFDLKGGIQLTEGSNLANVETLTLNLASIGDTTDHLYFANNENLDLSKVTQLDVKGNMSVHLGPVGGDGTDSIEVNVSDVAALHLDKVTSGGDITATITGNAAKCTGLNMSEGMEAGGDITLTVDGGGKASIIGIGYPYMSTEQKGELHGNDIDVTVGGAETANIILNAEGTISYASKGEMADNVLVNSLGVAKGSKFDLGAGADNLTLTEIVSTPAADAKYSELTVDFGSDDVADVLTLGTATGGNVLLKLVNWDSQHDLIKALNGFTAIDQSQAEAALVSFGFMESAETPGQGGFTINQWTNDGSGTPVDAVLHADDGTWEYLYVTDNLLVELPANGPTA
ncbi:MAG: hypothetical protein HDQ91_02275, partial [Desulfovibrio sp.]|nr:hypothetical protein [Desulfovibrio sp.]